MLTSMNVSKESIENARNLIIDLNLDGLSDSDIDLEKILNMRFLTKEQKKEIAYQLRSKLKLSNSKIAQKLCVSHVTIGKWLGPTKSTKCDSERKIEQNICNYLKKKCTTVITINESIKEFTADFRQMKEYHLEEAEFGIFVLQDEVLALYNQLSRAMKELKVYQQRIKEKDKTR